MKKFQESLQKPVFTTKFVLNDKFPIVYVSHDSDGDWQFFSEHEHIQDEDIMIVSLEQIIQYDCSVNEIANLPIGKRAQRKDLDSNWEILAD